MAKESVARAVAILKRPSLSAIQFESAVTALLIHEERRSVWRRRIENAFETMAASHKRKV